MTFFHTSDHLVAEHIKLLTSKWTQEGAKELVSTKEDTWRRDGLTADSCFAPMAGLCAAAGKIRLDDIGSKIRSEAFSFVPYLPLKKFKPDAPV